MLSYAVIILHLEVSGHRLACNVLWNTFLFSLGYQHSSILHLPILEITAFVLFILSWRANKLVIWPLCHLLAIQTLFICKHFALEKYAWITVLLP